MPFFYWGQVPEDVMPSDYIGSAAPRDKFHNFPDIPFGAVALTEHQQPENMNTHVTFAGRRNRALSHLARFACVNEETFNHWFSEGWGGPGQWVITANHRLTFREVFEQMPDGMKEPLSRLPFRYNNDIKITEIPIEKPTRDPDLHPALHDLALMIRRDLREAIDAAHGDGYYPGVNEGIEPVPDSHVELVIYGTQRELLRERRALPGSTHPLPAYQLNTLPPAIQRAFAERRRLRFSEWGLGHTEWETGIWSIWQVPDDAWLPPWIERKTE